MGQKGDKKQGVYSIHAGCGALYGSRSRSQNPNKNNDLRVVFIFYVNYTYIAHNIGRPFTLDACKIHSCVYPPYKLSLSSPNSFA